MTHRPIEPDILSRDASTALREGDAQTALRLVDCRLAHRRAGEDASSRLLRAAALRQLGESGLAEIDIERARLVDSLNPNVLALTLDDRSTDRALRAARALLCLPTAPLALRRRALAMLLEAFPVICDLHRRQNWLHGWIYWRHEGPLYLRWRDQNESAVMALRGDLRHPLADGANVARLSVELADKSLSHIEFLVHPAGENIGTEGPFIGAGSFPNLSPPATDPACVSSVLIVVPVYDDVDATKLCLDSLLAQADASFPWRALIVNDASPNEHIHSLLAQYAGEARFCVLTNEQNLGFSACINHALQSRLPAEDVLLLNADAFLPEGALERLRAAASSEETIGTVTPLSNNGEQCSFPRKNQNNIIDSAADIPHWDAAAARCAGLNVVDMPNGVGFCLYIKAKVVDHIGELSDDFGRGYYEDVDYCLRAQQAGYRNVCAVGVIIGHWGTRSFRAEKSALVHKNLKLLEARYPGYRVEFAAFLEADPLAPWRRRIERALPPSPADILLIADETTLAELVDRRAHHLRDTGLKVGILMVATDGSLAWYHHSCRHARDGLVFKRDEEAAALRTYLSALGLERIEAASPVVDLPIMRTLLPPMPIPVDILILDASAASKRLIKLRLDAPQTAPEQAGASVEMPLGAAPASRIRALNGLTYHYAVREAGISQRLPREAEGSCTDSHWTGRLPALLMPVWSGAAHEFGRRLAEEFRRRALPQIVLMAPWVEDVPLLRMGNVTLVPYQSAEELGQALRLHAIKIGIHPYRSLLPEPEHDVLLHFGLGCAFFDFSGRYYNGRRGDCRLAPAWSDAICASTIASWFERLH